MMISPFAGFFYASFRFEPLLGFLSATPTTAWLDGFFLNHSVVTHSYLLEAQREIGSFIFALGLWGFLVSAFQVYYNKIRGRGVASGLLYRISRHPQYLSLGVAGWGLLTIWPRFLLLGCWVTMLFLYAALARFEEQRMEERFGASYRAFAGTRGAFLPGSPVRRLFEATFGRMRPRAISWAAAYVFALALSFSLAFMVRGYTRAQTAAIVQAEHQTVVISAWPQSTEWIEGVMTQILASADVQREIAAQQGDPVVATILNPGYKMKGMFYLMPDAKRATPSVGRALASIGGIALSFLVPTSGWLWGDALMGADPDAGDEPVQVVLSKAAKPFKETITLDEVTDPSVRLTPFLVVDFRPSTGEVEEVRVPLPQNRWGPQVVMPIF